MNKRLAYAPSPPSRTSLPHFQPARRSLHSALLIKCPKDVSISSHFAIPTSKLRLTTHSLFQQHLTRNPLPRASFSTAVDPSKSNYNEQFRKDENAILLSIDLCPLFANYPLLDTRSLLISSPLLCLFSNDHN